jgi:hypothetical protein
MRFILLMVAALLATAPVGAQDTQPSSATSRADGAASSAGAGPVSLDRIRDGLSRATLKPLDLTAASDLQADYKVNIQQQLPIERFFRAEDFKPGPVPFGGVYGLEMQRVMTGNPNRNPGAQPYAAFTHGELLQVAGTSILFDLISKYLTRGIGSSLRSYSEKQAHEEVTTAIREYCAAQPHGGDGITICER